MKPTLPLLFFAMMIAFAAPVTVLAQVPGCTDPYANNYNPSATLNNGSCLYTAPPTYTPPLKVSPLSDSLKETSGLQWAGNTLWSFNDGGGSATLYRIDTLTKAIQQRVMLQGALNIDWEDIAFDGTYFYIGDFGNNANGARTDLTIYKFPLAAIPVNYAANYSVTIPAAQIESIHFVYKDQGTPVATTSNNTKYDCEAMLVDNGKIHLFTKDWISLTTTHYIINEFAAATDTAVAIETLAAGYLVTAADKAVGQNVVVLLGYQNTGLASHFMYLLSDYTGAEYFSGNKRKISLPDVTVMGQGEGITFRNSTQGYISNENFVRVVIPNVYTINIPQQLRVFDIAPYVSRLITTYIFTGNGNWDNAANWSSNTMPPATLAANSQIIIDPLAGGECVLNIAYTVPAGSKLIVNANKSFVIEGNLTQQ